MASNREELKVQEATEKILTWITTTRRRSFKVSQFKEDFKTILTRFVDQAIDNLVKDGSLDRDGSRVPLYTVNTDKVVWESEEDSDDAASLATDAAVHVGKKRARPAESSPPFDSKTPKVKNVKPRQEPLWWREESEGAGNDSDDDDDNSSGSVYESDGDHSDSTTEQGLTSSRAHILSHVQSDSKTEQGLTTSGTRILSHARRRPSPLPHDDRTSILNHEDHREKSQSNSSDNNNGLPEWSPLKKKVLDYVAGRHPHNLFPLLARLCEDDDATTIFDILDALKQLEEDCMLKVFVMGI